MNTRRYNRFSDTGYGINLLSITLEITQLNDTLAITNTAIGKLSVTSGLLRKALLRTATPFTLHLSPQVLHDTDYNNEAQDGIERNQRVGSTADKIGKLSDISGSLTKFSELIDASSIGAGGLQKAAKSLSGASAGVSGAAQLLSGAATGMGLAEGMAAAAEFATGVTTLAEVFSGPPGWAILLGTILTGVTAAYLDSESRKRQEKREKKDKDEGALQSFRMSSEDANKYHSRLAQLAKGVNVNTAGIGSDWNMSYSSRDEVVQSFTKHPWSPHFSPVIPKVDNTDVKHGFVPGFVKENSALEQDTLAYVQQRPQIYSHLLARGLSDGLAGFEKLYLKEIALAKVYDASNNTNKSGMVELVGKEVSEVLLRNANQGKKEPIPISYGGGNIETYRGRGRTAVVNINLNKPMIEHFSIHTSSTEKSIDEIRHKVEEVLLEILNSANTIN